MLAIIYRLLCSLLSIKYHVPVLVPCTCTLYQHSVPAPCTITLYHHPVPKLCTNTSCTSLRPPNNILHHRYAGVFWGTNKAFGLVFFFQLLLNATHNLLVLNGYQVSFTLCRNIDYRAFGTFVQRKKWLRSGSALGIAMCDLQLTPNG